MSADEAELRSTLLPRSVDRHALDLSPTPSCPASHIPPSHLVRYSRAYVVLLVALVSTALSTLSATLLLGESCVPAPLRPLSQALFGNLAVSIDESASREEHCPMCTSLPTAPPPLLAPSKRFVFNASGLASSPSAALLRARSVLEVCYETEEWPPPYWLGSVSMDGTDGPIVPLYRAVPGAPMPLHCAAFVLPRAGTWNLELQQPQKAASPFDDMEPHHCRAMLPTPNSTQLHHLAQTSAVFNRTLAMCGWTVHMSAEAGLKKTNSQILHPPQTAPMRERIIARHRFTVAFATDVDEAESANVQRQLYHSVYRNASLLLVHNTIGYWQRRPASSTTPALPGTSMYQPEPTGCPTTFYFHNITKQLPRCNFSAPALQWHPTFGSRAAFLASPSAIREYVNRTMTVVVGDSLGAAVWRGLRCVVRGYAQVKQNALVDLRVLWSKTPLEMMAMFPPLGALLEPSYAEFVSLIVHSSGGYNPGGDTVFVWNVGMWMVSWVASSDWNRGLLRLMRFIKQYAAERLAATGERQRHYFNMLTGVHSTDDHDPNWQTASRVYRWNVLLLQVAVQHSMPLIDLHSPSSVRPDARVDNCHYCDYVSYELAHIVLNFTMAHKT